MKVALPVWGHRLSPVLDFARRLLVVETKNGSVTQRWHRLMNPQLPSFSQAAAFAREFGRRLDRGVEIRISPFL